MIRFLARRLAASAAVLLGVSVITFILARLIPTNAAAVYIGPKARPEDIERVTRQLGLDQPLPVQYLVYMRDLLTGNWGTSIGTKRPVLDEILSRLPATIELIVVAMVLAVVVGVILGVASASVRSGVGGRATGALIRVLSIGGVSMPAFWLGLLLQVVFFRVLHVLPLSGQVDSDLRFTNPITPVTGFVLLDAALGMNWAALGDAALHVVLPALTLAAYPLGLVARMTRASMLEALEQDYIRTARAYGISSRVITYRLALRNALLPVVTVIGLSLAYMLTGAFFVEILFSWPGLGTFVVHALLNVDYPAIMGVTLFGAAGYVLINLAVDVVQAWLDPRLKLAA